MKTYIEDTPLPFDSPHIFNATPDRPLSRFGRRKSVHLGWFQVKPVEVVYPEQWPEDAAQFLDALRNQEASYRIRVCSVSREGDILETLFVDPELVAASEQIAVLEPEEHNLMFDPVPYRNGKRLATTRFGWLTVSGAHPFESFPEPVIFWAVGANAYQALIPWYERVNLQESCRRIAESTHFPLQSKIISSASDLLHIPGSLVHSGKLPPFTAEVLYDAMSATDVETPPWSND
jgi:hypothetical protein